MTFSRRVISCVHSRSAKMYTRTSRPVTAPTIFSAITARQAGMLKCSSDRGRLAHRMTLSVSGVSTAASASASTEPAASAPLRVSSPPRRSFLAPGCAISPALVLAYPCRLRALRRRPRLLTTKTVQLPGSCNLGRAASTSKKASLLGQVLNDDVRILSGRTSSRVLNEGVTTLERSRPPRASR